DVSESSSTTANRAASQTGPIGLPATTTCAAGTPSSSSPSTASQVPNSWPSKSSVISATAASASAATPNPSLMSPPRHQWGRPSSASWPSSRSSESQPSAPTHSAASNTHAPKANTSDGPER